MIKQKTKQFADELVRNPKLSQTDAYLMTHETNDRTTARVNASVLMQKPEVQIYMAKHVDKAKSTIVSLMNSERDDIKLKASESILDREYGKPLTRTNSLNLNVNVEDALQSLI